MQELDFETVDYHLIEDNADSFYLDGDMKEYTSIVDESRTLTVYDNGDVIA